jgi:two-component system, sensor histidine kinase and response regulator
VSDEHRVEKGMESNKTKFIEKIERELECAGEREIFSMVRNKDPKRLHAELDCGPVLEKRVLIVENDEGLSRLISKNLNRAGVKVVTVTKGDQAIEQVCESPNFLMLLDYRLPDMTGRQLVERLEELNRPVPFIMMTGQGDEKTAVEMMRLGAQDYLVKNTEFLDLLPEVVGRVMGQLVTEEKLKQVEAKLRESEGEYRRIFENIIDIYYSTDLEGNLTLMSPSGVELLGYHSFEEMVSGNDGSTIYYSLEESEVLLKDLVKRGKTQDFVVTLKKKDGTPLFGEANVRFIIDDAGTPIGVEGIFRDITKRKEIEGKIKEQNNSIQTSAREIQYVNEELRQTQAQLISTNNELKEGKTKLQTILDTIYTGVVLIDAETHKIVDVNAVASRLLGVPKEGMIGQDCYKFVCQEEVGRCPITDLGLSIENTESVLVNAKGNSIPIVKTVNSLEMSGREYLIDSFIDITKRKRAEEALKESEERFRKIGELSPFPIWVCTSNGRTEYINPQFTRTFGYTIRDMPTAQAWLELVYSDPEKRKNAQSFWGKDIATFKSSDAVKKSFEIANKDGSIRNVTVRALRMDDKRTYMVFHDITEARKSKEEAKRLNAEMMETNAVLEEEISERKRAESALRESEERFRELSDLLPQTVFEVDLEGRVIYANRFGLEYFGYTEKDISNRVNALQLFVPEDQERIILNMSRRLKGESFKDHEYTMMKKEGSTAPVLIYTNPISSGDEVIGLRGIALDITERKKAEERLRLAQERYRTVFENSAVGITVTDGNENIVSWNKFAEILLGTDNEELYMRPVKSLYPAKEWRRIRSRNIRQKGMQHQMETRIARKDGEIIDVALSLSVLKGTDGAVTGSIGVIADITERKLVEAELQRAKEAAETATLAKSEFLASMSHEIRTPMNAILGMADLLSETDLTSEQVQYVHTFQSAGENLLSIINDILDISKVEAGHLELEVIDFDLVKLLDDLCEVMAIRAHEKGIELGNYIAPDVPTRLVGDPTRLRQIITNLMGNAIKFTEMGKVFVEINKSSFESGSHGPCELDLLCSVSDTGIGIPEDKVEDIFEVFTQVDASTTRRHGGTGLGLTISKQLSELMGGRIWAESGEGKGSTFRFTAKLGVQPEQESDQSDVVCVDVKGLKTLVIDDTDINRMILRKMLCELEADVTEAEDGYRGLAALKHAKENGDSFGLVLLDCRMPGMDGFEMMEKVNSEIGIEGTTIMMLTSDSRSGDIGRSRELGIASYLVKPVKRHDLLETISTAMGQKISTEKRKPADISDSTDLPALTILLVEDNADNRLLVQAFLKKTPYQLDIAENGEIAVEKFKSSEYDLVLMDVQMPVMDGYTATGQIRAWEKEHGLRAMPVIALTAHATSEDEQKSLRAGCTGHLTKPIKKAKLLESILEYSRI